MEKRLVHAFRRKSAGFTPDPRVFPQIRHASEKDDEAIAIVEKLMRKFCRNVSEMI